MPVSHAVVTQVDVAMAEPDSAEQADHPMLENIRQRTDTDSSTVDASRRSRGSRRVHNELRAQERGAREAARLNEVIRLLQHKVGEVEMNAQGQEEQLVMAQAWCQNQARQSQEVEEEYMRFQLALHTCLLESRQEMVTELEIVAQS